MLCCQGVLCDRHPFVLEQSAAIFAFPTLSVVKNGQFSDCSNALVEPPPPLPNNFLNHFHNTLHRQIFFPFQISYPSFGLLYISVPTIVLPLSGNLQDYGEFQLTYLLTYLPYLLMEHHQPISGSSL